ncbi:hypothetical protein HDU98_005442, partial [Podochytrium sp. JEL0797]
PDKEKFKLDPASFKFSTAMNARSFIAREQGLKHPVLQISTREEVLLFKDIRKRFSRNSFDGMCLEWNVNPGLDGKLLTYKLPEHLSA